MRPTVVTLAVALVLIASAAEASPRRTGKTPSCPAGQRPTLSGCRSSAPEIRPRATAAKERPAADAKAAPKAPETGLRFEPTLLERADRRLLITEIARLEELVKATRAKSPDRAGLVRRLADAYAELAALSRKELTVREIEAEDAKRELQRDEATRKPITTPPAASVRPTTL
jgi:hypothetical protein